MTSAWDSCASHNFMSTRLAAECIAAGARYSRCALPIRQGEINAGVSRIQLVVDLVVVHRGQVRRLNQELF